jgi:hypothetical protein
MSTQLPKKTKADGNKIVDASLFKKNKQLEKDKCWNDIICQLALTHKKADEELKELAKICSKENDVG